LVFCFAAILTLLKKCFFERQKMFTVGKNNLPQISHTTTDYEINLVVFYQNSLSNRLQIFEIFLESPQSAEKGRKCSVSQITPPCRAPLILG
jgi:hypothetical protein